MKPLLTLISLTLLSGCASIAGPSYPVKISSTPSQANFTILNQDGKTVTSGQTPATVKLKSGAGYFDGETYQVKYSKTGYNDAQSTLDSSISGWYAGNLIIGGLLVCW